MPSETVLTFDLRRIVEILTKEFGSIESLHLFGSRRHKTRSLRSDIDILVCASGFIRPDDLRQFIDNHCPPLDLFLVHGTKAISCSNESYISAASIELLQGKLDAVELWSRKNAFSKADIDWNVVVARGITFHKTGFLTAAPIPSAEFAVLRQYFATVKDRGIEPLPFIGDNAVQVANYLTELIKNLVVYSKQLSPRGLGWKVDLKTEYDFQNLFFLGVKPWFPGLGKEEVAIIYDEQEKRADFNLFGNQIIIEMKHIRDLVTKTQVAKTLEGLNVFYARHANVRVLLFVVLVAKGVDVDAERWNRDFSYLDHTPQVRTVVVKEV